MSDAERQTRREARLDKKREAERKLVEAERGMEEVRKKKVERKIPDTPIAEEERRGEERIEEEEQKR